jgi:hypothetical protein
MSEYYCKYCNHRLGYHDYLTDAGSNEFSYLKCNQDCDCKYVADNKTLYEHMVDALNLSGKWHEIRKATLGHD